MFFSRLINIFFAGSDPHDRAFAEDLARRVQEFRRANLVDIDAAESKGLLRRDYSLPGTNVYVLSTALLAPAGRAGKLLRGSRERNMPGVRAFFICRGMTPDRLRHEHPAIGLLLDDVMVADQDAVDDLVAELREYKGVSFTSVLMSDTRHAVSMLVRVLFVLLFKMYRFGLVGPLCLFGLRTFANQPDLEIALFLLTGFTFGHSFNELDCYDLCFELGHHWKIVNGDELPAASVSKSEQALRALQYCGPEQFDPKASQWLLRARVTFFGRLLIAAWLVSPVILFVDRDGVWGAWVLAVMIGLSYGPARYHHYRSYRMRSLGLEALTPRETARMEAFFATRRRAGTQPFINGYLSAGGVRGWTVPRDRVFISYAWKDGPSVTAASAMFNALTALGVSVFQDVQRIHGSFAPWRRDVVDALIKCTHFVVVLGSDSIDAPVMHLELKTALQRLFVEVIPAIICVVEPETLSTLLAHENLPDELRFALLNCPSLTFSEARDPRVLRHILRQRRRQHIWTSWKALLGLERSLKRLVREEIRSTSSIFQ